MSIQRRQQFIVLDLWILRAATGWFLRIGIFKDILHRNIPPFPCIAEPHLGLGF